jgi:lincosamide nucleotidyltransferase A/C/D/E
MPPGEAASVLTALDGVDVCLGGGWAVDARVGRQTREHSDLDLWVAAPGLEGLFVAFADLGLDRIFPWPGDRPWNFVLHDGSSRRVDLHLYERLDGGSLHYGSVTSPFLFSADDLAGEGAIEGVRCDASARRSPCATTPGTHPATSTGTTWRSCASTSDCRCRRCEALALRP